MNLDDEFPIAKRENTAIVLALCGGSGSGKTNSALELAVGLAGNGEILLIDSEGGRGKHYADDFRFRHYDWQPPYSPQMLGKLLRRASERQFAVVIVDSMSSEHEDEGGLCDMADAELQKQTGAKNSAAAWARPKSAHKHEIVRWLRTARCHIIFCCRASEKVRFDRVEGPDGRAKTVIVPLGWTPVAEKNLLYDVTTSLLFTPDRPGKPQPIKLYARHAPFFPPNEFVTREAGRALAAWAAGAQQSSPRRTPAASEGVERSDGLRSGGAGGSDAETVAGNPTDPRTQPRREPIRERGTAPYDPEPNAVPVSKPPEPSRGGVNLFTAGVDAASHGTLALEEYWTGLTPGERKYLGAATLELWKADAAKADAEIAAENQRLDAELADVPRDAAGSTLPIMG